MTLSTAKAFIVFITLLLSVSSVSGGELSTRYTTISYDKDEIFRQFNKKLTLGSLSYLMRHKVNITTEDEVKNKIDIIIEKVEAILDMFPEDFKIKIVLLPSTQEVQKVYKVTAKRDSDLIAFYTPKGKTVYLAVSDIRIGVLAHELGHAIMDAYFVVAPPSKIHEVLAQFVETHLND